MYAFAPKKAKNNESTKHENNMVTLSMVGDNCTENATAVLPFYF